MSHNLKVRDKELNKIYGGSWNKLRANEKAAISSAYFNSPKTVGKGTRFHKNIMAYTETGDKKYLLAAVDELRHKSNPKGNLQDRRNGEADLLNSTHAPVYSPPNRPLIPQGKIKIIAGETVVPIGLSDHYPTVPNSEYYIWRTALDHKVRATHQAKEGRVFKRGIGEKPGDSYNCRCHEEEITINLEILEQEQKTMTLGWFIKYGGAGTILLNW